METLPQHDCHISVPINPLSGKGRAVKTGQWLTERVTLLKIRHQLFTAELPLHFEEFSEVWVVGGDGTVNYFLNHYRDIGLPLVFFKGGTGNYFSWKLYGDISLPEQLGKVLSAKPKKVDAASCNGQIYANSLGIGFDGEVLQSMGSIGWMGGHFSYLWVVLWKIFSFR